MTENPGEDSPATARAARLRDPEKMTSREKRRRLILLAILLLILALLGYLTYYYVQNRRLPSIGVASIPNDYIAPPEYLYSISGQGDAALQRPVGVGVADDGRVYVVDFGKRRVSVFTNQGRYLFSFSKTPDGDLFNAVHLAVRGNEVWVSDRYYRKIYIFDLNGNYVRTFTPKQKLPKWTPLAFSFDTSGALRVTDVGQTNLHRLLYFSVDGSRTASVGHTAQANSLQDQPGGFMFPNGVAVGPAGDVYVADGDNRRVQVFNPAGVFERFIDTSGVPRGIAIDSKGRLYVADALAHTIGVYDLKGKFLTQFGTRGFGAGQFNYPNDIALDKGGRIYISDRENDRIQVWAWPAAQLPKLAAPKGAWPWLTALACLLPLLLIPLLLSRRKIRFIVTPDFMDGLIAAEEIDAVYRKSKLRLIAPEADRALYEGRIVEAVDLGELLFFEEYSESDALSIKNRLHTDDRNSMLIAMALRAKALATTDEDLRLQAMVVDIRVVDVAEFREIYLKRDSAGRGR